MTDIHIPVLLDEVLAALIPSSPPQRIIDGTVGLGGHTSALLDKGVSQVLGMDLDVQALAQTTARLEPYGDRAHLVHASYVEMREAAQSLGWQQVDGILLDLGVSSLQLDTPERGFAFRYDGPLDMRFDPESLRPPASEIVNTWPVGDLIEIFYKYGEEKNSRIYARAIVKNRPFETTSALADAIQQAAPRPKKRKNQPTSTIHPATRIFQALRIAVNGELEIIEKVLPIAIDLLAPGGRLAVISFHSLEDRIVKQVFKDASTEIIAPPGMASIETREATVELVNRKPIEAAEEEKIQNPRSRSAKLRVIEKL